MDFNQLCNVAESLQKFSVFNYKLENRKFETDSLREYVNKLPKHLNVFSFPYQYAFEENLIQSYNKSLSVWSGEKINQDDPNRTWTNAKRFLKRHSNCEVYLPSRVKHGGKIYPLSKGDKLLSLGEIFNGEIKMGKVDFSPWHVQQKLYNLPNKFDIIDLDYVRSLDIENFSLNIMAWDKIKEGGLLYTTFSLTAYRQFNTISSKYKDIDQKDVNKFNRENIINKPSTQYVTINRNNLKMFGVQNNKKFQTYENMVNNYIDLHFEKFNTTPVFVNIYRGGDKETSPSIMCRIVWLKGVYSDEKDINDEKDISDNLSSATNQQGMFTFVANTLPKDDIFDMYFNKKLSANQIAKEYGVDRTTITDFIRRHGGILRPRGNTPLEGQLPLQKDDIFDMYFNKKLGTIQIAKKYGVGSTTIGNFIRRHGGILRSPGPRLEGQLPLQKDDIFDMYFNKKLSTTQIAKKYGVGSTTILNFIRRHGGTLRPPGIT